MDRFRKKNARAQDKCLGNIAVASSSTSQKTESANMHTDPSMRNSSSRTSRRSSPFCLESCSSTFTQRGNPSKRGGQNKGSGGVSDQQRSISAKDRIFVPGTIARRYRPRDSGGQHN